MSDELKTPWKIMPCRENKGHHEYHDNRYIVTDGSELVKGFDPRDGNWSIRNGSLICQMRDISPLFAQTIVHRVNCHDKLVDALESLILQVLNSGGEIHTSDCYCQSIGKCTCGAIGVFQEAKAALELAKGGSHD